MESAAEDPYKAIDGSVGALVWVRRRNGSWWPGRILSPDELPEGCLSTPRAGTPVKLLGREDASVDWYNLEKSKRVKAFRCGEYNDCIEKAKELSSHLSKKAVKYARREDAILHALRLENIRLEKDFPGMSTAQEEDQQHHDNEEQSEEGNDNHALSSSSEDGADSAHEPSQSVVSFEESKDYLDSKRRNDSEDDAGAEKVSKRMRGVEDLGMGVGFERRKRSQVGHCHEFLKKKYRRRTLSKVLERTPMVFVPVGCEHLSSPTGLEPHEPDKINNNNTSDSTNGVSCENGSGNEEDGSLLGLREKENEISSVVGVCEEDDGSREKLFDVPLVGEEKQECAGVSQTVVGPADIHDVSKASEKGTSKWQLKGKRNSRPRKIDTYAETRSNRVGGPLLIPDARGFNMNWNNAPLQRDKSSNETVVNSKFDSSDSSSLHDVNVEVQTSYRPRHVPYISLMSKLNGKPVVGHPLSVEILEDGYLELEYRDHRRLSEQKLGRRPPSKRRSKSKSRKNGLLSTKIRKLSSLSGSQRQKSQHGKKKPVLDSLKGPSIACIPLKVVFSRINASLNSSVRSQSRLSITSGI